MHILYFIYLELMLVSKQENYVWKVKYLQKQISWVGYALLPDRTSAVGLLCDGVCRERIGGTFHTLGAAWWGVGSSFMDRGHLAGS